jgi:hypothetical protein
VQHTEPPGGARDAESAARLSLIRGTLFFGALLAATVAGIAWIAVNAVSGAAWVSIAFLGLIAALLAIYVAQHLRDLRAAPVEREGVVNRKWTRADLIIVMQSYYIAIGRAVFRIPPEEYIHLQEGMRVRVTHLPHTMHVVSLERLPPAE